METKELIGYAVIVFVIALLIYVQLRIYIENRKLIKDVKTLFPEVSNLSIIETNISDKDGEDYAEIKTIQIVFNHSINNYQTFQTILDSINNYLYKNKGVISDFMLIKDIVERNCDSKEEEINTQTPIPLYIGLMGTMIGIIIGIGRIALLGGGFSAFINNPQQAIGELMGGVAIAMIASLVGILLTTWSSMISKSSKTKLEADKNEFYSWIQAELLPVLSGNMGNTLQLLQQNLTVFNQSFSSNIGRMESALSNMSGSFTDQLSILNTLKNLDIHKMATANVTILREFEKSTSNFQQFSSYMSEVTTYLQAVRQLNDTVSSYMGQTKALTNLANYFKEENSYFQERRAEVNKAVVQVDDTLKKSFQTLQDYAEQSIVNLAENIVKQRDKFNTGLQKQDEDYQQWLTEQKQGMAHIITEQEELFKTKIGNLTLVVDEIRSLSSIKESLNNWGQLMQKQNEKLSQVTSSLNNTETIIALQSQHEQLVQILIAIKDLASKQGASQTEETLLKQNQVMMQKQSERIAQLCSVIENMPSPTGELIVPKKRNPFKIVALWLLGIMLFLASGSFVLMISYYIIKEIILK